MHTSRGIYTALKYVQQDYLVERMAAKVAMTTAAEKGGRRDQLSSSARCKEDYTHRRRSWRRQRFSLMEGTWTALA